MGSTISSINDVSTEISKDESVVEIPLDYTNYRVIYKKESLNIECEEGDELKTSCSVSKKRMKEIVKKHSVSGKISTEDALVGFKYIMEQNIKEKINDNNA